MEGDIGPTATAILDTQKEEEVREWGGGWEGEDREMNLSL